MNSPKNIILVLSILIGWIFTNPIFAQDNTPPVITVPALSLTAPCNSTNIIGNLTDWYNNHGGAEATDNSGVVSFFAIPDLNTAIQIFESSSDTLCGLTQSVEVQFIAIDGNSNQSLPSIASFSTIDNTPPIISKDVEDVNISCFDDVRDSLITWIKTYGGAEANDACTDSIVWTDFATNLPPFGTFPIDEGPYPNLPSNRCDLTINVTFFLEDNCGNKTTTSGSFNIFDNSPPVFDSLPGDVTLSCAELDPPINPLAFDQCYGETIVQYNEENNQSSDSTQCDYYNYEILRVWTSIDPCGNQATHRQNIAVRDQTSPHIEIQSPLVVDCKDILAENVMNNIDTLYDDCSDSLFVTFTDNGNFESCEFSLLRIYTIRDICDNETQDVQTLLIKDEIAPVITKPAKDSVFMCDEDVDFNAAFLEWLSLDARSASEDECSVVNIFAAIPGSYDVNDPNTFPGIAPDSFIQSPCPSSIPGFLRHQTVDFLHIDECQNITVSSAIFGIIDQSAPIPINCPNDVTITLEADNCETSAHQIFPSAMDDCTATTSPIRVKNQESITSNDPGNPEVVVNPVTVNIGPFNTNTFEASSNPTFEIEMQSVDADDVSEYFNILNEDGIIIGQTPKTINQCGDTTFVITDQSLDDLNRWLDDGFVTFTFEPNIPPSSGVLGINAVCINSRISVEAIIEIETTNVLSTAYIVNNSQPIQASIGDSINFMVGIGSNEIQYLFEDCAGNSNQCIQTIIVEDMVPPTIECGDTLKYFLTADSCNLNVTLPIDVTVSENCRFSEVYNMVSPLTQEAQQMIFAYDSALQIHTASNRIFRFENIETLVHGDIALLEVEVIGDINDIGEEIEIRGEGGTILGKTTLDTSNECGRSVFSYSIPKSAFNLWANDGIIEIFAITPSGSSIEGGGINPCINLASDETVDGQSFLRANLRYFDANLEYELNDSGNTLIIPPSTDSIPLMLNLGINNIKYTVRDQGNNKAICRKIIQIQDTIPPNAICKDTSISVHPSGIVDLNIDPNVINNNSSDNCSIHSLTTSDETFDCSDIGTSIQSTLYVGDQMGNIDSCSANIDIIAYEVRPTFTAGLCIDDTLKLFSNIPETNGVTYTYEWKKDGVFFSNEANPQIANSSTSINGQYTVEVTGFNDCVSLGSIEINITPLTQPDLVALNSSICEGDEVVIQSNDFSGPVVYSWFEGIAPNGNLLATTATSSFIVTPSSLNRDYYVVVNNAECETPPSNQINIAIYQKPVAMLENNFISVCEGDQVMLRDTNQNTNYNYSWVGPDDFRSDLQAPTPFVVTTQNEGTYQLVINIEGCQSDTAVVTVVSLAKPQTPILTGESIYCKGSTFSLSVNNVTNATSYMWFRNGLLYRTTMDNTLAVPNAQPDLSGDWTVVIVRDGCSSTVSSALTITIDDLINVGADNTGPVCAGDSVTLNATFVPNATYEWSGPNFSGSGQTIKAPSVAGDYNVTITTATNCTNVASTNVEVNTPPEITALSSNNTGCVDNNSQIDILPTIFPSGQYDYEWNGPNGFFSNVLSPTLSDLDEQDIGTYVLTVFKDGCPSIPKDISIDFDIKPEKPIIEGNQTLCAGDTLNLVSNNSTAESFIWITPQGVINQSGSDLTLPNIGIPNIGSYSLIGQNGSCQSDTSDAFQLIVNEIPEAPTIQGAGVYCFHDTIVLHSFANGENFEWVLPDNSTLNQDSIIIIGAKEFHEGNYQLTYERNGCISEISEVSFIEILDSLITPSFQENTLSFCSDLTSAIEICMNPDHIEPNTAYQLYNDNTGELIAETSGLCFTISDGSTLTEGANNLYIQASKNGCYSRISNQVLLLYQSAPNIIALAMDEQIIACDTEEFVALNSLFGPPEVDVQWIALTPGIQVVNDSSASALAKDFLPGENLIRLTYSKDGCNEFTSDTVQIFLHETPLTQNDDYQTSINQTSVLNIYNNDILAQNISVSILDQDNTGTVTIIDEGIQFIPNTGFAGTFSFTYQVCIEGCSDLCSDALVTIEVGLDEDCTLPTIFTPNNDGINDQLILSCINTNLYPKNEIWVFNEWGDEVFYSSPYDNTWEGTYGGEPLPVGTYFVVFEPGEGKSPIKGFLILQR